MRAPKVPAPLTGSCRGCARPPCSNDPAAGQHYGRMKVMLLLPTLRAGGARRFPHLWTSDGPHCNRARNSRGPRRLMGAQEFAHATTSPMIGPGRCYEQYAVSVCRPSRGPLAWCQTRFPSSGCQRCHTMTVHYYTALLWGTCSCAKQQFFDLARTRFIGRQNAFSRFGHGWHRSFRSFLGPQLRLRTLDGRRDLFAVGPSNEPSCAISKPSQARRQQTP